MSRKNDNHEGQASPISGGPGEDAPPQGPGSPAEPAPAPTAAVEEPQEDLAALRCERDDLLARLQRVSADYLNYQKRVQRDVEMAREFANEQLVKALLPVLDDLERALEAARQNHGQDDPLMTGTQLIHQKALETLGRFGLSAIEAEGKPFDPDAHSAVMQEPSDAHLPETVLRVLIRGYRLKGRIIRPCGVVVSTAPRPGGGGETDHE